MNEPNRKTGEERLADEGKLPRLLALGAVGMVVAFVGMGVVLLNARDEYGWAFNLGVAMVIIPVMGVLLDPGVRALEQA